MERQALRKEEPEKIDKSRRGFMLGAVANVAVAYGMIRTGLESGGPVKSAESEDAVEDIVSNVETSEVVDGSERFDQIKIMYKNFFSMGREVMVVNEQDEMVARINLQEFYEENGIDPGKGFAEQGMVTDGFSGAWKEAVRESVALGSDYDPQDLRIQSNWQTISKAVSNKKEQMTYENTHSILDVVNYFANKEVREGEGLSRHEYVREKISFTGNLAKTAPVFQLELRRCMPGLCGVESSFNDAVISKTGARGIFQFMPTTWHKELGRPDFAPGIPVPLIEQTKAAGELFSKMYDRLPYWCYEEEPYSGRNYLEEIKQIFASKDDFEQYFFLPCLLNSYNTGEQGMGELVQAFVETGTLAEITRNQKGGAGFDIFQAMTDFGRDSELPTLQDYGDDASRYVQRIYALADLLDVKSNLEMAEL